MFNLSQYNISTDRITDLLPWACLVAPGIILNKDGSLLQTLQYRGPDLQASSNEELINITAKFNNLLKRLESGWVIYFEARRQPSEHYAQVQPFPDPISWLIDAERRDLFERNHENYESRYYISFQYMPPSDNIDKAAKYFYKNDSKINIADKHLQHFTSKVTALYDLMINFMYEADMLNDDDILTYLHQCISDKQHFIKAPDIPMYLDAIIADKPLLGGLKPKLGQMNLAVISIQGFPSSSEPGILDALNRLPIEYRWCTRYIFLDKAQANSEINKYKKKWFSKRKGMMTLISESISKSESAIVDSSALRKSQDADSALQELNDNYVSFGYYTATITLWDEDEENLKVKSRKIEQIINSLGFTTIYESVNTIEAWLSSLPGQCYANVRMPLLHTLNLSHLVPFSSIWSGQKYNQHLNAPPLLYGRTYGNTPFRLSLNIGDVGHMLIAGPTGAGKSVLLNFMALQFLRYKDAQVFIFDKGYSFFKSTHGVNGNYYNLGSPDNANMQLQPLAGIDNLSEKQWAHDWIIGIIENENIKITPQIKEQIWSALTQLASQTVAHRTLSCLSAFIQDKNISSALSDYLIHGAHGNLLDDDNEKLEFSNWQCFEMETLMETPQVIAPVLKYIFHKIEQQLTGKPTLILIDEAWLFLDHPLFADKIRSWLKTLRKQNTSVIFATQSIDDLTRSKISSSLLESCPSRIFLPNSRATEPDISQSYQSIGLSDEQIRIIAHAEQKKEYYYSSMIGNALFTLNLDAIALFFSTNTNKLQRNEITSIAACHNYNDFLEILLKNNGLNWAFDIISERLNHEA